jgi:hypothetical protein
MPKPHQHAKAIHAWADGAEIEFRPKADKHSYGSTYDWYPCRNPDWHENFEYRIKGGLSPSVTLEIQKLNVLAKMHEDGD